MPKYEISSPSRRADVETRMKKKYKRFYRNATIMFTVMALIYLVLLISFYDQMPTAHVAVLVLNIVVVAAQAGLYFQKWIAG